ncbi:MAG TPA: hypothetical protein VEA69_15375 [Tepidisphaeraceae bacterium]|nr:hypothetical protein [Tepidisphaeraceae bacterium]
MNRPARAKLILLRLLFGGAVAGACAFAPAAHAGEPVGRQGAGRPIGNPAQVAAATRDAVDNLLDDVGRTHLANGVTVRDFLRATGGLEELTKDLQTAEQVGNVRWIDDRTCQVELQISGARVARRIETLARAHPKDAPLAAPDLEKPLAQMRSRSFSATGTSVARPGGAGALTRPGGTGGNVAQVSIPSATGGNPAATTTAPAPKPQVVTSPRWASVAEGERELVLLKAKLDAAQTSLRSVSPVMLSARSTVGDVLADGDVGPAMEQWFITQPVTRVEYRDDMLAEVALDATPAVAFDRFRALAAAAQARVAVPPATDDVTWAKARDGFRERMAAPVGRAALRTDPIGFAPRRVMGLPGGDNGGGLRRGADAPAWVGRRLEADGIGTPRKGRLMTARAAEAGAEAKLRAQVEALEWRGRTIGVAAKDSRRIDAAVTRALQAARIGKTEYREDGSARVDLYLDLETLWAELREAE